MMYSHFAMMCHHNLVMFYHKEVIQASIGRQTVKVRIPQYGDDVFPLVDDIFSYGYYVRYHRVLKKCQQFKDLKQNMMKCHLLEMTS